MTTNIKINNTLSTAALAESSAATSSLAASTAASRIAKGILKTEVSSTSGNKRNRSEMASSAEEVSAESKKKSFCFAETAVVKEFDDEEPPSVVATRIETSAAIKVEMTPEVKFSTLYLKTRNNLEKVSLAEVSEAFDKYLKGLMETKKDPFNESNNAKLLTIFRDLLESYEPDSETLASGLSLASEFILRLEDEIKTEFPFIRTVTQMRVISGGILALQTPSSAPLSFSLPSVDRAGIIICGVVLNDFKYNRPMHETLKAFLNDKHRSKV